MALLDHLQNAVEKVIPSSKSTSLPSPMSARGIGPRRGMASFDDDMIVSKPAIIFHASQIFFNFLAMCCFASVAAFQAHWNVGPSGLTGFALFITILGIFYSLFLLFVPVISEKYDRLNRLARALKEVRVSFILAGAGVTLSLLISFIITISAWTEPGCKDPNNDPNANLGDDFKNGLSGWCSTKKAGAVFLWLAFGFWIATFVLAIIDWRRGKNTRPRDPPFNPPIGHNDEFDGDDLHDDEESLYNQVPTLDQTRNTASIPASRTKIVATNENAPGSPFADSNSPTARRNNYGNFATSNTTSAIPTAPTVATMPPSRPSMDAYGAFSDPAPSGFGSSAAVGSSPGPGISRTMQYADPYAAVRQSIGLTSPTSSGPPGYGSEYTGYR